MKKKCSPIYIAILITAVLAFPVELNNGTIKVLTLIASFTNLLFAGSQATLQYELQQKMKRTNSAEKEKIRAKLNQTNLTILQFALSGIVLMIANIQGGNGLLYSLMAFNTATAYMRSQRTM